MPAKNLTANRAALGHRLRCALHHPERVPRHLVRSARDLWLRRRHRDHVAYYRAVMRSDTRADPDAAVGSASRERWPVGVSEIRRNKPIGGPSRAGSARTPRAGP
jgi:hypothetical protein